MSMKFDAEKGDAKKSTQIHCGKGLTKQSFSESADINKIVLQYKKTGVFQNVSKVVGQYADVSSVKSYKDGLSQIIETQEMFAQLPAEVRERFKNDPAELLEFVVDDSNHAEAVKLGLIPSKETKPQSFQTKKRAEAVLSGSPDPGPAPDPAPVDPTPDGG